MLDLMRYEVHPGNRLGERRVYARLSNGELRRLRPQQEQIVLLRFDINEANKGNRFMRYVRVNRKLLIFGVIAALAIIVALTVNFPSF